MTTFREAIRSDAFTLTADLTLQTSSGVDDIARQVDLLGPYIDGLQLTDSPWAWVQMSAVAAASLVMQLGIDPIPILTCRDRNRIALQADLLGLRALGVSSVLLIRGHKIPKGHPIKAGSIFEASGRELVAMAAGMAESDPAAPEKALFIGVAAKVMRPSRTWKGESLNQRSSAGAQFLQTQLCFNTDILRAYMQRLVDLRLTWKYAVMVSLAVLPSAATAVWLKKNFKGSRIPDAVINRLEKSADPEHEGIAICAELMQEISQIPGVSGVNLVTVGNPQAICDAIKLSGLRS